MRHATYNPIRLFFGYIFAMLKNLFTARNRVNEETTYCLIDAARIDNGQPNKPNNNIALTEEQNKEEKNMSTAAGAAQARNIHELVEAAVNAAATNTHAIYCKYHNRALEMHQIPETIEYRYRGLYAIEIVSMPFGKHDSECIFSDKEMALLVPNSDSPVYHEFAKMFRASLSKRLMARQGFIEIPKQEKKPAMWVKTEHPFVEYVDVMAKNAATTLCSNILTLVQQRYMDAVSGTDHVPEKLTVQYFPNGTMIRITADNSSELVDFWYQIKDIVPENFVYSKFFTRMMNTTVGKAMLVGDLKVPKNIISTELFNRKVHSELLEKLLKAGFVAEKIGDQVKYLFSVTPRANIGLAYTPDVDAGNAANVSSGDDNQVLTPRD